MDPNELRSDADRLLALRETGLLDRPPPPEFADLVARAKAKFGVAAALVTLVDLEELRVAADALGPPGGRLPRAVAFCDWTIRGEEVFVVPDLAADPRFADNPLVAGPPFHRFYAGAPLVWTRGVRLGSLCLLDGQPREFSPGDRAELAVLADEAVTAIAAAEARFALPPAP